MIERPYWQKVLYNAWPYVRRITNNGLFRIVKVVRSGIRIALDQIKLPSIK